MPDVTYGPKVYNKQGGDEQVIASGGKQTVESGGTVDFESGAALKIAGTQVTSSAAELNQVDNTDRLVKVAKVGLTAADTAGGLFAWQNDEGAAIIVTGLVLDVTTKATGACTVDIGTTATNATTLSDNLIDGLDVNAATGVFDNITDKGTNGKSRQRLADGKWVTGSVASGASAGIVGYAYIKYIVV